MTSSSDVGAWRPLALESSAVPAVESAAWLPVLPSGSPDRQAEERAQCDEQQRRLGFEDGVRRERERADELCLTALAAVAGIAAQLELLSAEFARDRVRDLHGLALAVARQVVQHELTIAPERLADLVRMALEQLPLDARFEVRLNPVDLETLSGSLETLVPPGRHVRIEWLPDATLERGGFIVESPQRVLDGRADVALRLLYERLEHA